MTEYTKADYLKACEALFDGKPTEYCIDGIWKVWESFCTPFKPDGIKWRPVDPLREYKEAFEAGKRVEWKSNYDGAWIPVKQGCQYLPEFEYRIVEEPKTVRLFPFARRLINPPYALVHEAGYFKDIHEARRYFGKGYYIYPINQDGSIEVTE